MRVILLCLFSVTFLNTSAKNYYVSASHGNSGFTGLLPDKPKKTIQDAADLTLPGDTVFVMNGTYSNSCPACNVVDITRSGNAGSYIVYTNYRGHQPVLRFNGWGGISIKGGASYIVISGFEIIGNNAKVTLAKAKKQPAGCVVKKGTINPVYNGNGIVLDGRDGKHPHHIRIAQNKVHDCGGGGIGANQADYVTVEDNLVYNNSWYSLFGTSGISFYQFWNFDRKAGYHNIIRRNKTFNNRSYVPLPWDRLCRIMDGNGIIIDDFRNTQNGSALGNYEGKTLIENNISWYNGGTGIHTFKSDHVDIVNNTAYCNSQSTELNEGQILAGFGDDIRIVNNILVSDLNNIINSNYLNTRLTYSNNLHYNITAAAIQPKLTNATCIDGRNPVFEKPSRSLTADFRLKKASPAISQGSKTIYSVTDFTGRTRRAGTADIGAYQNE